MIVSARFPEHGPVAAAIRELKNAGVDAGRIDLYSAKPVALQRGVLDRPSRMSLAAVAGAALCGAGATAFMFYAQMDYPLVTGGMPLNSMWATGVISFEATMGGAVLAIALMFLKESGLVLRRSAGAAPIVSGDEVVVRIACASGEAGALQASLIANGASQVDAVEEPV
jgi:hypothetical protein